MSDDLRRNRPEDLESEQGRSARIGLIFMILLVVALAYCSRVYGPFDAGDDFAPR